MGLVKVVFVGVGQRLHSEVEAVVSTAHQRNLHDLGQFLFTGNYHQSVSRTVRGGSRKARELLQLPVSGTRWCGRHPANQSLTDGSHASSRTRRVDRRRRFT